MSYKHASDEVSTVSTNSCYVILLLVKCEIIWKHSTTLNVGGGGGGGGGGEGGGGGGGGVLEGSGIMVSTAIELH